MCAVMVWIGMRLHNSVGVLGLCVRRCSSCFVHSFFRKMHCIEHTEFTPAETARIRKFGDGGYLMTSAAQEDLQTQSHADRSLIVDFSLFFQSAVGIQDYAPAVCSTLQPSAGLQQQVEAYVDAVMSPLHGQMTPEYRTVALHVRRGDYAVRTHPSRYGLLDIPYYVRALEIIADRLRLTHPESAAQLVAVVFTTQESVGWCHSDLAPRLRRVAKHVLCANTSAFTRKPNTPLTEQSAFLRCNGEEVDLLAMSLFDFIVVANSTFSWQDFCLLLRGMCWFMVVHDYSGTREGLDDTAMAASFIVASFCGRQLK
eukprot:m.528778 g.528778  ORF g.528778 m.528778 type:complete len:313 (-) comp22015_c0_seq73:399-1337(-)